MSTEAPETREQLSWGEFVNEVYLRLTNKLQSGDALKSWQEYVSAWRYIITGNTEASSTEATARTIAAVLTSPDLIAALLVILTGLGGVASQLLSLYPTILVSLYPDNVGNNPLYLIVKALFLHDGAGLQFIVTSFVVGILLIPIHIYVVYKAKSDFFQAKKELIGFGQDDDYWRDERSIGVTKWYRAPLPFTYFASTLASCLNSIRLFVISVLSLALICSVNDRENMSAAAGIALCLILLAWPICWSNLAYRRFGSSDGAGGTHSFRARLHKILAGFDGLPLGIIGSMAMFLASFLVLSNTDMVSRLPDSIFTYLFLLEAVFFVDRIIRFYPLFQTIVHVLYRRFYRLDQIEGSATSRPMTFKNWLVASLVERTSLALFFVLYVEICIILFCQTLVLS